MEFAVVSTCNEKGWKLYGRRMVKSFIMYWPSVWLHLYAEGFKPDVTARVSVRELPEWQTAFKARHAEAPMMNGRAGSQYDLIHDAVRFSHKVGAVIDFIEACQVTQLVHPQLAPDVVIWLDADVVTHAPIRRDFLKGLVDDWPNTAIAWLDRAKKYPECGFVIFNLGHPLLPTLIEAWKAYYTKDTFLLLDGWTDCHTLQRAVELTQAPWASLSGGYTNVGHPFVNGPLGAVMDHLKGDRKRAGRSSRYDLRARRKEHYWR